MYAFVYLLRSDQYVSNQYILDQNPRVSSYTIGVTYSDYILLLLVCGDFPLTLKTGRCWNLLESTPARIPLIKSSHKWTRMLFITQNSKLGIWLCSQPRIDLNSQSNFYNVLTGPYRYLLQHTINKLYKTTCTEHNLYVSFTRYYQQPQGYIRDIQRSVYSLIRRVTSLFSHGMSSTIRSHGSIKYLGGKP